METIIEFIKKFQLSNLGLDLWDMLTIVGLTIAGMVLANWIASFLPVRTGKLIKTIMSWTLSTLAYGLIVLMVLNSILTEEYTLVLVLGLLFVSKNLDYWHKLYDDFVDRRMNRDQ